MAQMGIRGSLAPVVTDILRLLKVMEEQGHSFIFQWIPGHCGIPGNDEADAVAADAHHKRASVPIILSKGDRRGHLRQMSASLATEQWRRDVPPQSFLHRVDPDLSCRLPKAVPRPLKSLFHRLRLNVSFTPTYRHQLGCSINPLCTQCHVPATAEHLLLECSLFGQGRDRLKFELANLGDRPFGLSSILGPWDNPSTHRTALRSVASFLRSAGQLAIL